MILLVLAEVKVEQIHGRDIIYLLIILGDRRAHQSVLCRVAIDTRWF